MQKPCGPKIGLCLCLWLVWAAIATAQPYTNLTGLTTLYATTTNVNGTGIRVGQPEANGLGTDPSTFEVYPPNQNLPDSDFTFISVTGTTNVAPNLVGYNSSHADGVADFFYRFPSGLATNVAHVDNFDADYYITNFVFNLEPAQTDTVVNQSYTFGPLDPTNQEPVDSAYDDYEETYGTFFVSAANNGGVVSAPGTAYNCISVGAYINHINYGAVGPTVDNGRCKPDITAVNDATSFTTPQVSGAAADLMQAALRGDGGSDTNAAFNLRTIKALLINGAVKPADWTNYPPAPLDYRYGSGVVNVFNSYWQLAGGEHGCIVSNLVAAGGSHPPTGDPGTIAAPRGWDYGVISSSNSPAEDAVNHYYFDVSNGVAGATFTLTATLVWNRHLGETNINNLSLFLYNCANSNLVAGSTSVVDNVQHIYQPSLAQGRYDLQVWKAGGAEIVSPDEPFALAFDYYSASLSVTTCGTNVMLTWPAYPAGFELQGSTNLAVPNWTNGLPPPAIMNSTNTLRWNPTNGLEFFRLHWPNL